jgi:peptidoglycan/xylan/chitin deacetylase (PgdA/CDA1 family)
MIVATRTRPIALSGSDDSGTNILRDYAEFWKIPYRLGSGDFELPSFVSGSLALPKKSNNSPIVVTPSGTSQAEKIAREYNLQWVSKRARLDLPCAPGVEVSIETEVYEFSGSNLEPLLRCGELTVFSRLKGSRVHLLSIDLIGEYSRRVQGGFEERPSLKFRIATKLPLSYQAIPKFIRDRSFRSSHGVSLLTPEKLGPVEFLRTVFLASIVLSSGPIPRVRFWKRGKTYVLAITHDVETSHGLEKGAPHLLEVERKLGVSSTWNLPSNRYPISRNSLREVAESGEIGGHDTKHDGRLILLNPDEKVKRLNACKKTLEELSEREVRGFRAPLLQHSLELTSAEAKTGYEYDSSCPSWEILSPTSMRAHGVGTVFPFEMNGVLEIPVSLPQDHQLMKVAGQTPRAAVDSLLRLSNWVRSLGGACIVLIHPDYELAMKENLSEYQRLLGNFVSDPNCQVMTMGELADWWRHREDGSWRIRDDQIELVHSDMRIASDLDAELVTGYGDQGFTAEALS